jgi:hypothetical protein
VDSTLFTVITTVQTPTESVRLLAFQLSRVAGKLIVIGDQKGPADYNLEGAEFLPLSEQLKSDFDLARALPVGHYARKNVGYLAAIRRGAACIYETDDDNAPQENWKPREQTVAASEIGDRGWVNVYRFFSKGRIWPRGFPLDGLNGSNHERLEIAREPEAMQAPIQQGLANNSPDVDAVWRLLFDAPFHFEGGKSVYLSEGCWCPFNSQSTWWWPEAYPLLYLPSYCTFRMTDIWRSLIAQRCLWALGHCLVFHGPEVLQQRNAHDLMRDFTDEIPGYTRNREMAEILQELRLARGPAEIGNNMLMCYEKLVEARFFAPEEIDLLTIWLNDIHHARRRG